MPPDELTCPCCAETFTLNEAAWSVCFGCARIAPPGTILEGESDVHPDPRGPGTDCFMGVRKYTERDAKAESAKIRNEIYQGIRPR